MSEKSIIILDTNIFGKPDSYDFKRGKIVSYLNLFENIDNVEIYLPTLAKEELKKHIVESIENDILLPKSRYSKEKLKEMNFFENLMNEKLKELEEFLKRCNIKELPCDKSNISIDEVNSWYFNKEYPFEARKKYEFLDAMMISAICNFLDSKNEYKNKYIVSNDKGFKKGVELHSNYKVNKFSEISNILLGYDDKWINRIEKFIYSKSILTSINNYNIEKINLDYNRIYINSLNIENLEIIISDMTDDYIDIACLYDLNVNSSYKIPEEYLGLFEELKNSKINNIIQELSKETTTKLKDFFMGIRLHKKNDNIIGYDVVDKETLYEADLFE